MRALAVLAALVLAGCAAPQPVSGAVTLRDVVDGDFASAFDKRGSGGVLVTVQNVTVREVRDESDGDWHLYASDPTEPVFIMEIIPQDQPRLSKPPLGPRLVVEGVPFCDTDHEDEAWHGDTCWELHPVREWRLG